MKEATLIFPLHNQQVLLGRKKRGFGAGKITGIGGRPEPQESMIETAIRELAEESGLRAMPAQVTPCGTVAFHFPAKPSWDMLVHLFRLYEWAGDAQESEELQPIWYDLNDLPYEAMWDDSRYWLDEIFAGKTIDATFIYAPDNATVASYELSTN